jgi:betaine-homocysteine S-methyltransferase
MTGADIVGINCHFDPTTVLRAIKLMKEALDKNGLDVFLMSQPLAYWTPDCNKQGFIDLPEFPFGKFTWLQINYSQVSELNRELEVTQ